MTTRSSIRITPNGIVEYLRILEDETRWRTTIHPGDITEAQKHLSAEELAQVQKAWTPEVVQKFRDGLPVARTRTEPRPPSEKERIATLEARVVELETKLKAIESPVRLR